MAHWKVKKKRGVTVLTLLAGPVGNGIVREAVAAVNQAACRNVVLDLAGIGPDLGLVKPLLTLRRRLQKKNGRLVLCGLAPETEEWLRATLLLALFEKHRDVASALTFLSSTAN